MRRLIPVWRALILALLFPVIAAAQTTGQLVGDIKDTNGKPYPDVLVEIKNPDTGKVFNTKTDKGGQFTQVGVPAGDYVVTLTKEKDQLSFSVRFHVDAGKDNGFNLNFKEMKDKLGPSPEELKKKEEEENKFKNMKQHFDAGKAALDDTTALRAQLKTAPADQKSAIQDKLNTDYQTAITELALAEQGVLPKDTVPHATVWSNLGQAYEYAGRYEEAANAFQKAVDLAPKPAFYDHLSLNLANIAVAQKDQKAVDAKIAEAGAACDKLAALDPTGAAHCWKNVGIVLSNKGHLKEAIAPLQRATQLDPKDAQSWFLLGSAFSAAIESKQQGDKLIFIIPPGTTEAYQKCIDAAPTGPYAQQAKDVLAGLAAMGGGEDTSIGKKKKK
ncbi:MAG: tetratricopeptide repeat protein [Candidatus Acidiferrales bacterium]